MSGLRGRWLQFEDRVDPAGPGDRGGPVPGLWRQATLTQTITGGTLAPGAGTSEYPGGPGYASAGWNTTPTELRAALTFLLVLAGVFVRLVFWACCAALLVIVTVHVGQKIG